MLNNVSRQQMIRWVAQYLVIAGVLNICFGSAMLGLGGLGGVLGGMIGDGLFATESFFVSIIGIVSLALCPAMVVVAVGLFRKQSWAAMGVVGVAGAEAVVQLLSMLTGGGLFAIFWLVISAYIAYLFYTDTEIKQILSRA